MYEDLFLILALFNTNISIKNNKKNKKQIQEQKRLENKIDQILAYLKEKENINE